MRLSSPIREMVCASSSSPDRIDSFRTFSDKSVLRNSPYPHYFPAPTGGRPQPGCFAHLHSRTPIYAGADHEVCIDLRWCQSVPRIPYREINMVNSGLVSWHIPKPYFLCPKTMTLSNASSLLSSFTLVDGTSNLRTSCLSVIYSDSGRVQLINGL
jgi:hypothetical protein